MSAINAADDFCTPRTFAVICAYTTKKDNSSAQKLAANTGGKDFKGKTIAIDTWSRCTGMAKLAQCHHRARHAP